MQPRLFISQVSGVIDRAAIGERRETVEAHTNTDFNLTFGKGRRLTFNRETHKPLSNVALDANRFNRSLNRPVRWQHSSFAIRAREFPTEVPEIRHAYFDW